MDLKEQLDNIIKSFGVSYKEARHLLEANVRKLHEEGTISKREWKSMKKYIKETLK